MKRVLIGACNTCDEIPTFHPTTALSFATPVEILVVGVGVGARSLAGICVILKKEKESRKSKTPSATRDSGAIFTNAFIE